MTVSPSEKPKRNLTSFENTYKSISEACKDLDNNSRKVTDPEEHQKFIRDMDKVLKLCSDHQRSLGAIRKDMGKHNESLRRNKPKGKSQRNETEPFVIDGKTYQLINGKPVLIENSLEQDNQ